MLKIMGSTLLIFLRRYGHHFSLVMCVVGFALDSTYLPSIDHTFTQIIALVYFGIATGSIVLSQAIQSNKIRASWFILFAPVFPLAVQFVFGGLLSVVFVYYFRSASLLVSWPLVLLLGALMAGNELWRKRIEKLEFQVTVLFLLFLFFSIFAVPLYFGTIGTSIFLLSVALSIVVLAAFIFLLSSVAWGVLRDNALRLFLMLTGSAFLVVGFYFANILPPIPLVTRADGLYHSLSRDVFGVYIGGAEQESWNQRYLSFFYPSEYHRVNDEPIYFYSAIYAPAVLHTPIVHVWQYWDEPSGKWITSSRVEFPMSGGRERGYRGYSEKESVTSGLWRVLVETRDGRTISQKKFNVVEVTTSYTTELKTL